MELQRRRGQIPRERGDSGHAAYLAVAAQASFEARTAETRLQQASAVHASFVEQVDAERTHAQAAAATLDEGLARDASSLREASLALVELQGDLEHARIGVGGVLLAAAAEREAVVALASTSQGAMEHELRGLRVEVQATAHAVEALDLPRHDERLRAELATPPAA